MKEIKQHIGQLTALFVGLLCVLVLHQTGFISLNKKDWLSYKESLDFYENVQIASTAAGTQNIEVIHPSMQLVYSTDGGDHFILIGDECSLDDVSNPSLTQQPYAWKTKAASWNLPESHSVVCFLVNESTKERSDLFHFEQLSTSASTLPQLFLNLPQSQFNSDANGLYAMGQNAWSMEEFNQAWWYRKANFNQRGTEWEKAVHFIYRDDAMVIQQKGGLKVSGNATRGFPQKSFKLYARKNYGSESIPGALFNADYDYQSLVLRTSGNDNTKTLFADKLMHALAEDVLLTQKAKTVNLFINGNYWGIYNIRERISVENIALRYDKKIEHITLLEDGAAELKDGDPLKKEAFDALIEKVKAVETVNQSLYAEIEDEIHLQSLCDYIFFETYFANNDWPSNNSICYKVKNKKWRWMLNDLDYSLAYPGAGNVQKNMFTHLAKSTAKVAILFNQLMTNDKFKRDFISNCHERMENELSVEKIQNTYVEMKAELSEDIGQHIARWRAFDRSEWEANCQANLEFLLNRKIVYLQHLQEL